MQRYCSLLTELSVSILFPSIAPTRRLRERSVQEPPRTLITTLFSLPPPSQVTEIPIAQLVDLMADLGTDPAAVRSAIMRLKQKGFLTAQKMGAGSIYRLSEPVRDLFEEDHLRMFSRVRADRRDNWTMVVFSIPESEREKRHALRTLLVRLGFGNVTSGVWITPGVMRQEAQHALKRAGLLSFVDMFSVDADSVDNPVHKIRSWWQLDTIEAQFRSFLQRWRPLTREALAKLDPAEQFRHYVLLLTDWRKIAYLDPGIPIDYLPNGFLGIDAETLFASLNDSIKPGADAHFFDRMAMW
jgi:phenylacetic acid degradation operon negative regulatory protein